MAFVRSSILIVVILIAISLLPSANGSDENRKEYIVTMRRKHSGDALSFNLNLLDQILEGSSAKESLVSFRDDMFNGEFVANLTEKEVQKLKGMEDIVGFVYPVVEYEFCATR